MGARGGFALKFLQWFVRGVQFLCAALILAVYSYFLATLHDHSLPIADNVRAVEGISGAAVLYSLGGLLLLCCIAGIAFFAFVAIVLDIAFIGAFIYVAWENRDGAGSCTGYVDTPFGSGQSATDVSSNSGFTSLPSFHTTCRLETACFAVAIVAIFFFVLSILMELALARHHRKEKRFGPSPANNYTSGYGRRSRRDRVGGFLGRIFPRRRNRKDMVYNENALPEHTHPEQLEPVRRSYGTETTAVNDSSYYGAGAGAGNKYDAAADPELPSGQTHGYVANSNGVTPHNYRYDDGIYDRM